MIKELIKSPEVILLLILLFLFLCLFFLSFILVILRIKFRMKKRRRKRKGGMDKEEKGMKTLIPNLSGVEVANFQHQGDRDYQEDAFGISNMKDIHRGILAVIADGMGGMAGGKQASNTAVSIVLDEFKKMKEIDDPASMLVCLAEVANEKVSKIPELLHNDGGTTLILCYMKGYEMYYLSIGDSRICLARGGELIKLNKEHILANSLDEMVRRGEMDPEEARTNPMRKMLTSFVGADEIPKIDYSKKAILLKPEDKVILMSDGVFGTISEEEILEALDNEEMAISARLLEHSVLAKKKKHQDNMTAVIIKKG